MSEVGLKAYQTEEWFQKTDMGKDMQRLRQNLKYARIQRTFSLKNPFEKHQYLIKHTDLEDYFDEDEHEFLRGIFSNFTFSELIEHLREHTRDNHTFDDSELSSLIFGEENDPKDPSTPITKDNLQEALVLLVLFQDIVAKTHGDPFISISEKLQDVIYELEDVDELKKFTQSLVEAPKR